MNVLNNAAKYTDRGGDIRLSAALEGEHVVVSVKDSGIGIERSRLPELFTMFSQVEGALSRSRGGLGIGLALAKRLVEMHGGTIEAQSEGLGHGSLFKVTLPVAQAAQAGSTEQGHATAGTGQGGLRILVADDNQDATLALAKMLEAVGHTVRTSFDGTEALEVFDEFEPELVLLDIGMPGLNGLQACARIRSKPKGRTAVLVAITGWGQPEDRRLSGEAGFDHHLVKPVDPTLLLELIALSFERTGAKGA
jgi:CheY-like chemotaxis protein/anti-sigma regulatory factor (Ser/Thr protein kinase)